MADLYASQERDFELVAAPLFEASEIFVRSRGAFLPHGAALAHGGEVRMVAAAPKGFETRAVSPEEVLPALHEALRAEAHVGNTVAVAVAEDVTITFSGQRPTQAIKVLCEHRDGLTLALYVPCKRTFLRSYSFGDMIVQPATPEVCAWPPNFAS